MKHILPSLPFAYDALEPYIDKATMLVHHTKHHQAYVDNLNKALESHADLQDKRVEWLITHLADVPGDIQKAVRNHGGGHLNHTMFWKMLGPQKNQIPGAEIQKAIDRQFQSIENFQKEFTQSAVTLFGSGWAWLSVNKDKKFIITQTQNQDSPLTLGLYPILCIDVWEHAYYLRYQNRRVEYVQAWWNIVNWEEVEKNFKDAKL